MVIFSFGLLFEGIEIMGEVMKPLAGSAIFVDLMGKVSSIPILGVVLAAMYLVSQELENLAEIASEMLDGLKGSLSKGKISTTYEKFKEELEHCVSITLELLNEAMEAVKEGSEEQGFYCLE